MLRTLDLKETFFLTFHERGTEGISTLSVNCLLAFVSGEEGVRKDL